MKEDFLALIKTKDEANKFFEFVDLVVERTYGIGKFDKNILDKCVEEVVSIEGCNVNPPWFEKICKQLSRNMALESVRTLLEELSKLVSGAELVKIEVSFNPSQNFIDGIYEAIRESSPFKFLMDIEVNPKLHGGAKFFISGKYINLTLGATIAKYLRTKDVINRYL